MEDAAPLIPLLTRPKPTMDVRNVKLPSTSKVDRVIPTETVRGLAASENSNKAPEVGIEAADAANEWNCNFSTSDSDASMMEGGIATENDVGCPSNPVNNDATCQQSQPNQPIHGVEDAVEKKVPIQKQDDELGTKSITIDSTLRGTSMTNSTSPSSSDDGSVSSTSSDGTSSFSSSSSSSSSSTR